MVCDHVAILNRGELKFVGAISDFSGDQGAELDITVCADEPAVRELLGQQELKKCTALPEGRLNLVLRVKDQADIDRVVDSFRNAGTSIEAMAPRKRTLEDIFLELVLSLIHI